MIFKPRTLVVAVVIISGGTVSPGRVAAQQVDPAAYLAHVRLLASDDYKGRGNGTPELDRAADYIAEQFRTAGLEPGGDGGTFLQPFEVVTGLTIGGANTVILDGPVASATLVLGRDYRPVSIAGSGGADLSAQVVFAGYGISAPDLQYDDYAGLDVAGKAVLVLRHEPQEGDENSRFDGREFSDHATFLRKAQVARSHGAAALLVVDDPNHSADATFNDWLEDPQAEEYGLPLLLMPRGRVQEVLGELVDFEAVFEAIDADLTPRSTALGTVSFTYRERINRTRRTVNNVVGVLRGADASKAGEAVVVGAHYDHLGTSGRFSLARDSGGQIHNGADDNASGTAAVIEIARLAAANRAEIDRSMVFVAFAGEELGLLGSRYYLNNAMFPPERTVAMINLDMVGRSNGRILASGVETGPELASDLEAASDGVALTVTPTGSGSATAGASDHLSFELQRVPAVFFFSGLHADYHRPTDDWEKIDAEGGAAVAGLAYRFAARVANRPDRVAFVPRRVEPGSESPSSGGGGYGPYFGSVPDFAEGETPGVKFADVREGSPAGLAGLRQNDVMIGFDGKEIRTLYDFTFALREKKPGDRVEVVVIREGRELRTTVELGNRP